jgi:hypothetical protein
MRHYWSNTLSYLKRLWKKSLFWVESDVAILRFFHTCYSWELHFYNWSMPGRAKFGLRGDLTVPLTSIWSEPLRHGRRLLCNSQQSACVKSQKTVLHGCHERVEMRMAWLIRNLSIYVGVHRTSQNEIGGGGGGCKPASLEPKHGCCGPILAKPQRVFQIKPG